MEYFIHDNGGRPFMVTVGPSNKIGIYEVRNDLDDYEEEPEYYSTTNLAGFDENPNRVFVGEEEDADSPLTVDNYFEEGNTMLLRFSDNRYVFIGRDIYTFSTDALIYEYHSPIGNNDVPYPYAIDTAGKYYLMLYQVVLPDAGLLESPYDSYWQEKEEGRRFPEFQDYQVLYRQQ